MNCRHPDAGQTDNQALSRLRIVEIGDKPFVKQGCPDQVAFCPTASDGAITLSDEVADDLRLGGIGRLWQALHDPGTSLVICHPTYFAPWHWQSISRALFRRKAAQKLSAF